MTLRRTLDYHDKKSANDGKTESRESAQEGIFEGLCKSFNLQESEKLASLWKLGIAHYEGRVHGNDPRTFQTASGPTNILAVDLGVRDRPSGCSQKPPLGFYQDVRPKEMYIPCYFHLMHTVSRYQTSPFPARSVRVFGNSSLRYYANASYKFDWREQESA